MSVILISVAMTLLIITNILKASMIQERINRLESEMTKLKIRTECIRSEMHMKIDEFAAEQIKGE